MKTKKQHILVLLTLLLSPFFLAAQTADEIIAKHIEAHGGASNWNRVKALKISGKFTAFSLEKDFTSYKTSDGKYFSDRYLGVQHVLEGFTGKFGWTIDPWMEIDYARHINAAETNVFKQKAEFCTPLFNYKERGSQVKYLGKEKVDGSEMFVIQLTRTDGKSEKWFLNTSNYLEYKCESNWVDFAQSVPVEIYFDDFREVNGVILPFFTEHIFRTRDRITQIEKIEVNPAIDTKMFAMPKSEAISKIAYMAGNWDVSIEILNRKGEYQKAGTCQSQIVFAATNLLRENINYEIYFPYHFINSISYNEESKKYRLTVFNDFTSSQSIYQGEESNNVLHFDDKQIRFSDNQEATKPYQQFVYTKISDHQFSIEYKPSKTSNGNEVPAYRFTYTRQ